MPFFKKKRPSVFDNLSKDNEYHRARADLIKIEKEKYLEYEKAQIARQQFEIKVEKELFDKFVASYKKEPKK